MISDIVAPPPEARERLMRQVAKEPKPVLPPEPVPVAVVDRADRVDAMDLTARQDLPVRTARTDREDHDSAEPVFATRQRRGLRVEAAEEEEEKGSRSRPGRAPWVLAWTGWAVAAGCSFVAGLQFHQRQQMQGSMATQQAKLDDVTKQSAHAQDAMATLTSANAMQVALHSTADVKPGTPTAAALAAYLADKGALVFVATHMDPAPAGKTYELWLMPADGRNPMPVEHLQAGRPGQRQRRHAEASQGHPGQELRRHHRERRRLRHSNAPVVLAGT